MEYDALPAYTPQATRQSGVRASIALLPLHLLHRIVSLTLDPQATPSRFAADAEEERVRRVWMIFRSLRGVDRRLYLVSTSILRTLFLPHYLPLVLPNLSSDPFPHTSIITTASSTNPSSVFATRGRETAVFDRFIAVRVGEDLRRMESELTEEGEGGRDIFTRLQPAARLEDLLLTLPSHLVVPTGQAGLAFPLPQSHLSISLTPTWIQLYLHASPVAAVRGKKVGKEMVLEVRREGTLEATLRMIGEGLNDIRKKYVRWGERV